MIEHGVHVTVIGDDEAKAWLRGGRARVNDWLYQLTDSIVFHEADQLHELAPGRIKDLVSVALARETEPGVFEGTAGVEPEVTEASFARGLGSDPADFPVYVDQGTGIFGEFRSPIYAIPGHVMGPIEWEGRTIYVTSFKGQPAQHFSDRAFADTVAWIPARIEEARAEFYAAHPVPA